MLKELPAELLLCSVNVTHAAPDSLSSMFEYLNWVFIQVRIIVHIHQSKNLKATPKSINFFSDWSNLFVWMSYWPSVCLFICQSATHSCHQFIISLPSTPLSYRISVHKKETQERMVHKKMATTTRTVIFECSLLLRKWQLVKIWLEYKHWHTSSNGTPAN